MPPTFGNHSYEDKIILKAGASTVIQIPFAGCPQPIAEWKYKGGKLPDVKRFKADSIVNSTSLSMAKVVRSDAGKYSVDLKNDFGSATFNIELVVLGNFINSLVESSLLNQLYQNCSMLIYFSSAGSLSECLTTMSGHCPLRWFEKQIMMNESLRKAMASIEKLNFH